MVDSNFLLRKLKYRNSVIRNGRKIMSISMNILEDVTPRLTRNSRPIYGDHCE